MRTWPLLLAGAPFCGGPFAWTVRPGRTCAKALALYVSWFQGSGLGFTWTLYYIRVPYHDFLI